MFVCYIFSHGGDGGVLRNERAVSSSSRRKVRTLTEVKWDAAKAVVPSTYNNLSKVQKVGESKVVAFSCMQDEMLASWLSAYYPQHQCSKVCTTN